MTLQTWWLFVAAVFVLSGTPGPNMLHVMKRSAEVGFRRSTPTMLGSLSALLLALLLSAIGLAAVLTALPAVFELLRCVGIAYLVYLGVKAWREDPASLAVADGTPQQSNALPLRTLYRDGFLICITNPKLLLFATAFLPQFIDNAAPPAEQYGILLATYGVIELGWYAVYAFGGHSLARHLRRPRWKRLFNRLSGTVFIGFGLALLQARAS
jgi:threonine/homoserine/homoserine lactone efflux protein